MPQPFAQPTNFLDPRLTSEGKLYAPIRFEEITKEIYLITKHTHNTYSDVLKMTPTERNYILKFIVADLQKQKEIIDAQQQRANKK